MVAEEYLNSNLDIELDNRELSLYLAVTKTRQEIVSLGLEEVTHTRVWNREQALQQKRS